jgi:hypothetical protein
LRKQALLIFILRIAKLLVGLFSVSYSAKFFGVSIEKDNWLIALSLIIVFDATMWGALNEIFRTKFIFLKQELGNVQVLIKTKSLLFFILIISVMSSLVLYFSSDFIASNITTNYTTIQLSNLKWMIFLTIPFLSINQITAIGTSVLNAYDVFFIPEIAGIFSAIINLFILIILAPILGIKALVLSYYFSSTVLLCAVYFYLKIKVQINFFQGYQNVKFSDFKLFYFASLPLLFSYLIGQLSVLFQNKIVGSLGIGYLSILDYSRKFSDIFQGVLTGILMTILIPILSKNYVKKQNIDFTNNFLKIYQLSLIVLTFVIAIFSSCSSVITFIFYNNVSIGSVALKEISRLMIIYGWSILGVFHYMIFGLCFLSVGLGKKFAISGALIQLSSILIWILFLKKIGIIIFPISLGLTHFVVSLFFVWRFPIKSFPVFKIVFKYLGFLSCISLIIFLFNDFLLQKITNPYFMLLSSSLLTLFLMLIFSFLFRLEEIKIASVFIKKRIKYFY